jgi:hypothetical protein
MQSLGTDANENNNVRIDSSSLGTERANTPTDEPISPNRQRLNSSDSDINRQRLDGGSNRGKNSPLLPKNRPLAPKPISVEDEATGRMIEERAQPAPESARKRVFQTWQQSASKEPEVLRQKAGFGLEIPPTIHRQRVIDFSSINVFLEYEHEKEQAHDVQNAPPPEANSSEGVAPEPVKKQVYNYKLRESLDILKRKQDVVLEKLTRVQGKK